MQNTPRVQFSLPIAAGRACGGEGVLFSWEEIQSGSVKRVGPAMVRYFGMGYLDLGFEVPGSESLATNPVFRVFAKKLIRSIPSPFYALTLENDVLKLLFLATLDNLEIQNSVGDEHVRISANAEEYLALFAEEVSRLRSVLAANGGTGEFEPRMGDIGGYLTG